MSIYGTINTGKNALFIAIKTSMNNIEDFREAVIADVITQVQSMKPKELMGELINLKVCAIERMTYKELIDFRKAQIEDVTHQYGYQE